MALGGINISLPIIDDISITGERTRYWKKLNVPCYRVRLVKPLCKVKRSNLDGGHVGHVPEICLTPYS